MDMTSDGPVRAAIPRARWIRIIPPTIVAYVIAYMDRVNIGFAMAGGMNEALGLSLFASGLAAGIFFWGYVVLQAPGGHIAEHGSARRFILWTIVAWGVISALTGLVQHTWQLVVMRFLLGVSEGGVYPAILVLIGNWFPRKELGRANALFLISLPLSTALTNPISGWVVSHYGWRGLFFFEGLASVASLAVWIPFISDRPSDAKWISPAEKSYLLNALEAEKAQRAAASGRTEKGAGAYARLLVDRNLWIMITLYVCYTCGAYGYLIWLPTILTRLTHRNLSQVGWLSALPLATAIGGVYLFGALSDIKGNRRLYCALALWGFGIGLWLATLFPGYIWLSYGLLVVTGLLSKAMQSPFWSMPALVFPPGVAGGARGIINGLGNLGGFVGPALVGWFATRTGNMNDGVLALAAIQILGGCVTMLLPRITASYQQTQAPG